MPQIAPPGGYELIGPDGTRVVFNNLSDPDSVGLLDRDNGITGLLDGADVRESKDNVVEGDGAVQGSNWLSARVGTIQGTLAPNADISTLNVYEAKIKKASRALRGDAILRWTPTGGVQRQMWVRRQARVVFAGGRPKTFLIPLSAADPFSYSSALQTLILTPTSTGGELGFSSPITDPFGVTFSAGGAVTAVNAGDMDSWPLLTVRGPIVNPWIVNNTTGLGIRLSVLLGATDMIVVNTKPGQRSVLENGTNAYGAYAANFATNNWWALAQGSNDIRLLSAGFSLGAQLTIQWRHCWE